MVCALWIAYFLIWGTGIYINYKATLDKCLTRSGDLTSWAKKLIIATIIPIAIVTISLAIMDTRVFITVIIVSIFSAIGTTVALYKAVPALEKL